ncbi:TolC family protein [Candidatus Avelusimicrobium luingense]|uniref:TolC family protein n=1 Tax=Candidatus Avelusimicrobium luingense TaxID=3416211 RepID=UPI003D138E2B
MRKFNLLFIAFLICPLLTHAADDLLYSSGLYAQDATAQEIDPLRLTPAKAEEIDALLSGPLSLEDCIRIALANSPQARMSQLDLEQAYVQRNLSLGEFLPTVKASASEGYTIYHSNGYPTVDTGTSGSRAQAQLSISGFSDKVRAVKINNLQIEQAQLSLNNQTNNIARNVKKAYYALASAKRAVDIRRTSSELYKEQYERTSEFFKQGLRPKVDVTTAQVNWNNEKLRLIRAENLVKTASAKLANVLGITTPKPLEIVQITDIEKITIPFDEAVKTAYENRPDIISAQTNAKIGQIRVNQAKAGYLPTFSFSAGYEKYGDDSRLDNEETRLMIALEIPLFNAFKTYNGVKQARLNLEKINNSNRSLLNDVFLEVQSAYISMQEAAESVPLAELNVEKAKENLELAQGRYNEGISDIIELKDAEVAYTDAELSLLSARYDYAAAVADLKQAMGTN